MEYVTYVIEKLPYFLGVVGVLLLVAAVLKFSIQKAGVHVQSPNLGGRVILGILGALLIGVAVGLYVVQAKKLDLGPRPPAPKFLSEYYSYISVAGSEADCRSAKCQVRYFDTATVKTTDGSEAKFVGRIKAKTQIIKLVTTPRYTILNPEQYPENPTLLEFAIPPLKKTDTVLQAHGEALIENEYTPERGKIGPFLPYYAENVVVVVDLRGLDFTLKSNLQARIEARRADGTSVSGHIEPKLRLFADGRVAVISAQNLPAQSSVLLFWGE